MQTNCTDEGCVALDYGYSEQNSLDSSQAAKHVPQRASEVNPASQHEEAVLQAAAQLAGAERAAFRNGARLGKAALRQGLSCISDCCDKRRLRP